MRTVDQDPDVGLMHRVAAGDEAAMAEIAGRWERPVRAYVARFLGCPEEDARDVGQEVFLRVWRRRRRWEPSASFSTWLFTIATNLCRNRRRDAGRRPALVSVDHPEFEVAHGSLEAAGEDPLARVQSNRVARRVREAIARLPDAQRAAVLLRHFDGLSYREIAEVLDTSPSAVDALLVRGRRSLARSLRDLAQERREGGVQR